MGKVFLLDCTLRDGGYVNDWMFGEEVIKGFGRKIARTGIEYYEVGFIKGTDYNKDRAVFPDTESFKNVIEFKSDHMKYVGMFDMSAPVDKRCIKKRDNSSIDGIRVIFKKNKAIEAYEYCKYIKEQGYILFVNLVGTDNYSDEEFISTIKMFNELEPYGVSIVDSFGLIKRKQFLNLVRLADANLSPNIALCYHAHNNLQQAFGNAEALVELELDRDIVIDACVFGMGRGAGNLNLELFAQHMNENYDTHYNIEAMLEIMDEYLDKIYQEKFWGYSLPFYISANSGCHPNYAIYYAEKNSLTVKSFSEIMKCMSVEDKISFSKENAEKYYREYLENYIDDKSTLQELSGKIGNRTIILIAPGESIIENDNKEKIKALRNSENAIVIAVNFLAKEFRPDYIFSSNMRRYKNIQGKTVAKCITTSNMRDCEITDYIVNFTSCMSEKAVIIDNSGLMLIRLLISLGVKRILVAGMDGYKINQDANYYNDTLEYDFADDTERRNIAIANELSSLQNQIEIQYITPSKYDTK